VFQDFVVEELGGDDMGMSKSKLSQLLEQSGKEKKEGHAGHSKSWRSARSHVRVTERCELTLQEWRHKLGRDSEIWYEPLLCSKKRPCKIHRKKRVHSQPGWWPLP
jgi:hypothetical protein